MKQTLFVWGIAFLLFSCTKEDSLTNPESDSSFSGPEVTELSALPDSLKPQVVSLGAMPSSRTIVVPKADWGFFSFQDENGEYQTLPLLAPRKQDLLALEDKSLPIQSDSHFYSEREESFSFEPIPPMMAWH